MSSPRLYNTQVIILRRTNYGEADRFLTVFSVDKGKLRLLAKGVRKITSRRAGHVELFTHATIQVAKGRNIDILTQADTIEAYAALRNDLLKIGRAYYLTELVDKFTQEGDVNEPLFHHLAKTLIRLAESDKKTEMMIIRYFEVHLLRVTGFQPQLFQCVQCDTTIKPEKNYFSMVDGGVLCPKCGERNVNAVEMSLAILKMFRFFQTHSWEQITKLNIKSDTLKGMERFLLQYITFTLEQKLKSVAFLQQLRK
ncbi:MAG: DNA repair protein RecO [Anaerolineaceae bacterium 4572_78]|nr:MAG: DNA repair protein RecO [Anaerolineaceae bacterium 4572_78]